MSQYPLNLYWTGEFNEAVERGEAAVLRAKELHDRSELAGLLPSLGLALAASGRYRDAVEAFAEGQQVARELDTEIQAIQSVTKSVGFHIDIFDYEGAKTLASQVYRPARSLQDYPYMAISSGIDLMLIAARQNDPADADGILQSVLERITTEHGRHGFLWRMRLAVVRAELELAKGNMEAALSFAEEGLRRAREVHRPKYQALALEARGNDLLRLGRGSEAVESLREAVGVARPTGDPAMFLRAATQLLAVEPSPELLAEAAQAVDRIRSNLPDDMLPAFEDSEPVKLLGSLRSGEPQDIEESPPHGLSQREFEVLLLLAGGRSNQEIAESLVLSVRTVERHINHIYAKLGVHSRSQATALVMREGLLSA